MKTKIRNFRISPELDMKLVESAQRLGSDPSSYLRSLIEFGCSLIMHDALETPPLPQEHNHDRH
jgi:predicted DNA-binding protein